MVLQRWARKEKAPRDGGAFLVAICVDDYILLPKRGLGEFFKRVEFDTFKGTEFGTFKIWERSARTFESVMVLTCSQNRDRWVFT